MKVLFGEPAFGRMARIYPFGGIGIRNFLPIKGFDRSSSGLFIS
jgi:hypothetical protein